jgi:hypothetical protein
MAPKARNQARFRDLTRSTRSSTMRIAEIDQELRGYTVVLALTFTADTASGICNLNVQLARDEAPRSDAIEAEFIDVGQLSLREFGGGLTQLLYMRVYDISERGLDRAKLQVEELERDSIKFECRSAIVKRHFVVE